MYVPAHFAEPDPAVACALIEQNSFGMLVVPQTGGGVELAHLPFVLDREPAPLGTLRVHVARTNPIAARLATPQPVLAVFTGPHAYVSPRWYENPKKNVPTWNFTAVHVHGIATRIDERDDVVRALADLTAKNEAGRPTPWSLEEAEPAYIEGLLRGIVAFTIPVGRFETKMKLSQNRPPADRLRVVAALRERRDPGDEAIADLVEERARGSR